MVELKKILVPTDFSERAASAAAYAKQLAGRFQAQVALMHVIPPFPVPDILDTDEILEGCRTRARMRLQGMFSDNGFRPMRILKEGDPAQTIVEYARQESVDLIMMPTAGANGFRHSLLGSVTARTLNEAHCPVWITTQRLSMNGNGGKPKPPQNVVCAVDLGPRSAEVIRWAAGVAEDFGAPLTVVHALASGGYHPEVYYLEADLRNYLTLRARRQITEMLRNTARPASEIQIEPGPAAQVVRSFAEERKAQLLVIGRASHRDNGGYMGADSYAIIRESPCAVVSV